VLSGQRPYPGATAFEVFERLRAGAAAASPEPALALLAYFLARLAAFNEENAPLLGAMADAAGARRGLFYHSPMYGWMRQTVAALLRRAMAEGEAPALDLDVLPDLVLAPLAIDLYGHLRRDRGLSPEQITAALRHLLFDGLRGGRPGTDEDGLTEADPAPRPS
jgi:AcrR family transcriptional regulator